MAARTAPSSAFVPFFPEAPEWRPRNGVGSSVRRWEDNSGSDNSARTLRGQVFAPRSHSGGAAKETHEHTTLTSLTPARSTANRRPDPVPGSSSRKIGSWLFPRLKTCQVAPAKSSRRRRAIETEATSVARNCRGTTSNVRLSVSERPRNGNYEGVCSTARREAGSETEDRGFDPIWSRHAHIAPVVAELLRTSPASEILNATRSANRRISLAMAVARVALTRERRTP